MHAEEYTKVIGRRPRHQRSTFFSLANIADRHLPTVIISSITSVFHQTPTDLMRAHPMHLLYGYTTQVCLSVDDFADIYSCPMAPHPIPCGRCFACDDESGVHVAPRLRLRVGTVRSRRAVRQSTSTYSQTCCSRLAPSSQ